MYNVSKNSLWCWKIIYQCYKRTDFKMYKINKNVFVSFDLQGKIHWNTFLLVAFLVSSPELLFGWLICWILTAWFFWGDVVFVLVFVVSLSTFCFLSGLCGCRFPFLFLSRCRSFLAPYSDHTFCQAFVARLSFSFLDSLLRYSSASNFSCSVVLVDTSLCPSSCAWLSPPWSWRSSGTHHRWRCACPLCACPVLFSCWILPHSLCMGSTQFVWPLLRPSPSSVPHVPTSVPCVSGLVFLAHWVGIHHVFPWCVHPSLQLYGKCRSK